MGEDSAIGAPLSCVNGPRCHSFTKLVCVRAATGPAWLTCRAPRGGTVVSSAKSAAPTAIPPVLATRKNLSLPRNRPSVPSGSLGAQYESGRGPSG